MTPRFCDNNELGNETQTRFDRDVKNVRNVGNTAYRHTMLTVKPCECLKSIGTHTKKKHLNKRVKQEIFIVFCD